MERYRRNIKGFTLVELLAVIVILGLLIGIAFPSISSRIRETRDKTYTMHEADMKTAAMNLMSECVKNGEECVPNGESRTYYLSELIARKYSEGLRDPEDTDNYCDEEKSYVVVKNDSDTLSNFEYEVCLVCSNYESGRCKEENNSDRCENIDDNEGPDCGEVTGGSTIWTNSDRVISVGCKDKGGCGCSQDVYYKRFSETMEKGQIEIKDRKGNTTICPVNVYIDKNKPECELEVIGTMGENGWYGNEAPRVVFKSKTDKESGIESYGLGTSSKEYNFNREDEYTVPRGIVTIYGYVRDNAGNVGMCHTNTIHYDDVVPTITNVRYGYQVYPKEDMASVSGNTISINDITSEYGTIYGAYIYFNGNVSGNSSISNGNTNLVNRTLSGVDKMEYTFTPGVYNNVKITVPSVSSVKRIELLTGESNRNYYTNRDVTIYINSHDSYSGKAYYTFDGKTYQKDNYKTYTQNTSGIVVGVKDYAGNKGKNQTTAINNIDKEKPNCTLAKSGTVGVEEWYRSDITVSYKSKTDNWSGIRHFNIGTSANISEYNIRATTSAAYDNKESKKQTSDTTTSGQNWYGHIIDKAGNVNRCEINVKRDTVQPPCSLEVKVGNMGSNSWYVSDVTIGFANKEDVLSKTYQYDVTGSSSASYKNTATQTQTKDTDGVTYYGYVKDKAGNTRSCNYTFKKDATKPTCGEATNATTTWTKNARTIKQVCNDNLSGCTQRTFDTTYSTTTRTSSTTIYDNAGNSATCSYDVYVDTTAPSCGTVSKTSGVGTTSGVSGNVGCSDSHSGCSSSTFGFSYWKSSGSVTIRDSVGNTNSCTVSISSATEYKRRTRTCSSCYYGSNTCKSGYLSYYRGYCLNVGGTSKRYTACAYSDWFVAKEMAIQSYSSDGATTQACSAESCSVYSSCATGSNTCRYGCSSYSSWSSWSTGNSCSGYCSDCCTSESRVVYY